MGPAGRRHFGSLSIATRGVVRRCPESRLWASRIDTSPRLVSAVIRCFQPRSCTARDRVERALFQKAACSDSVAKWNRIP